MNGSERKRRGEGPIVPANLYTEPELIKVQINLGYIWAYRSQAVVFGFYRPNPI
jgi:hypothetical protein